MALLKFNQIDIDPIVSNLLKANASNQLLADMSAIDLTLVPFDDTTNAPTNYFSTDFLESVIKELATAIGGTDSTTRSFTENNVLANNDPIVSALDKLDLKWGDLASVANGEGASLVGVEDGSGNDYWTGTNAEAVFDEIGDLLNGYTTGSVLFAGADGKPTEDNASLFFDDTNNRLGVGTNSPTLKFQVDVGVPTGTDGIAVTGAGTTDADSTQLAVFNSVSNGLVSVNAGTTLSSIAYNTLPLNVTTLTGNRTVQYRIDGTQTIGNNGAGTIYESNTVSIDGSFGGDVSYVVDTAVVLDDTHFILGLNSNTSVASVTLPDSTTNVGRMYFVTCTNDIAGAGVISLATGTDVIGSNAAGASITLNFGESAWFISDGTGNWTIAGGTASAPTFDIDALAAYTPSVDLTNDVLAISQGGTEVKIGAGALVEEYLMTRTHEQQFTATAGQTSFTLATNALASTNRASGFIVDVYRNGQRLTYNATPTTNEYSAAAGVITTSAMTLNDVVDIVFVAA